MSFDADMEPQLLYQRWRDLSALCESLTRPVISAGAFCLPNLGFMVPLGFSGKQRMPTDLNVAFARKRTKQKEIQVSISIALACFAATSGVVALLFFDQGFAQAMGLMGLFSP